MLIGCMWYSELAVRAFTRLFLFQVTVIHLALMEAACAEMVVCHYTLTHGQGQSGNLQLRWSEGITVRIEWGSIPKNLDKNVNRNDAPLVPGDT